MGSSAFILAALGFACAPPQQATSPPAGGILAPAEFVPADVSLFLHVCEAATIRRHLTGRPLGDALSALVADSEVRRAWTDIAENVGLAEGELFDLCLGRSVSFAMTDSGSWVAFAELGEQKARALLARLDVRVREPRFGIAVSEVPEQGFLLACDGGRVLVGPAVDPALLDAVLARLAGREDERADCLASDTDFRQRLPDAIADLERAEAAVFVRHPKPLGGCSLVVVNMCGERLRIRQAARFENAPFLSPVTKLDCDFSMVKGFEQTSLIALMQPRDVGDGPLESYLNAGLGAGVVSPDMRANLGDRRMLIVGEEDGRQLPKPSDLLTTTFVAGIEVKDAATAVGQLDSQMERLSRRLNDMGEGAFLITMPQLARLRPSEVRHTDLGAASEWFTGGFPVMRTVSLNWAVASGPADTTGTWMLVGSHPRAVRDAVNAVASIDHRDDRFIGRFDNCGVANGPRLGRHLQSWSRDAHEFAEPDDAPRVEASLHLLGTLAEGLQSCHWQLARPGANSMVLDVHMQLAPPRTTQP